MFVVRVFLNGSAFHENAYRICWRLENKARLLDKLLDETFLPGMYTLVLSEVVDDGFNHTLAFVWYFAKAVKVYVRQMPCEMRFGIKKFRTMQDILLKALSDVIMPIAGLLLELKLEHAVDFDKDRFDASVKFDCFACRKLC